jgi:hypothetical protein
MRPNYLDRDPKATTWPGLAPPPEAARDISPALRRAFVPPEPGGDEWDRLLARIR